MYTDWKGFLSERKRKVFFFLLVITGFSFVIMFSKFMIWNECRSGMVINDPILEFMNPVNLSRITMPLTLIPILWGMVIIFTKPTNTVYFFFSAIFI